MVKWPEPNPSPTVHSVPVGNFDVGSAKTGKKVSGPRMHPAVVTVVSISTVSPEAVGKLGRLVDTPGPL